AMARTVVSDFGGEIPRTMEEMVKLPGVARKTANVVLGSAYGIPSGGVVDTHVIRVAGRRGLPSHTRLVQIGRDLMAMVPRDTRVAGRLGLTSHADPVKIERDLMEQVPRDRWIAVGHQLIWHGRRICHAVKPSCAECPLAPLCPSAVLP